MTVEHTLSIIKPDGVNRNLIGSIIKQFEESGLTISACKMIHMSSEDAASFYQEHSERPFFQSLVDYISSGPVVVQVLSGENAISRNREIMGATNPADAADGTIRKDFAESIEANSVHGSDSPENAAVEISYFFAGCEITS